MAEAREPRHAWLAIPGRAEGTAVVDAEGRLPEHAFSLSSGESTIGVLTSRVLPGFGLDGPVLDSMFGIPEGADDATEIGVFVELEPQPHTWERPAGWHDVPAAAVVASVSAELQDRFDQWVGLRSGRLAHDPRTPAWSRPGWHAEIDEWITEQLRRRGLGGLAAIEQKRAWGISSVLKVVAGDGRPYWFKAVSGHFAHEAAVTRLLHEAAPRLVAPVVATDDARGWLLLGDLAAGDTVNAGDAASHPSAYTALRALQRSVAGREGELVAAGASVRPLADLPAQLAAVLEDPQFERWLPLAPERSDAVVAWLTEAIADVAALGLPDVFVHGDFHPGNVATGPGGSRAIFDWSDAAITAPFVDVPTWLSWMDDDPDGQEAAWRSFAAEWSDTLPADEWLARRPQLTGIAGAYHTVSYGGIVASLEPLRRPEMAGALADFFELLVTAAAGAAW